MILILQHLVKGKAVLILLGGMKANIFMMVNFNMVTVRFAAMLKRNQNTKEGKTGSIKGLLQGIIQIQREKHNKLQN